MISWMFRGMKQGVRHQRSGVFPSIQKHNDEIKSGTTKPDPVNTHSNR